MRGFSLNNLEIGAEMNVRYDENSPLSSLKLKHGLIFNPEIAKRDTSLNTTKLMHDAPNAL